MTEIAHHYFAYGSNMNLAQMKERCSSPKVLGIARLPGYRFGFYGHCAIWDSGEETVVNDPGSEVWGILYELKFFHCEQLDMYQDVRFDGAGQYFHYPIEVIDTAEQTTHAMMYKKNVLGEETGPSAEYLAFIVEGATKQGLPPEYIALLQNRAAQPASYAVPIVRRSKYSYASATCGDCGE